MGRPDPPAAETPAPTKSSVVIVSYQSAPALRRCLSALEASTGREHFEVIVVDSGSRDETPQVEGEFPKVTFLKLPRNFGLTRARNIGSRTATGELILYLDQHVAVQPGTISGLMRALAENPDAVAANALLTDPSGNVVTRIYPLPSPAELYAIWRRKVWPPARPMPEAAPAPVDWIPAQAVMVRAVFLRGMNYFDERYSQYWSDLELCFQIRRSGKKNLLAPDVRAVLWPAGEAPLEAAARGLLSADEALGAATYAGKHFGWFAGTRLHIAASFGSLAGLMASVARARDLRYHLSRFGAIVSAQKVDGSQNSL